jgi:outer membrane protein TolC
MKLCKGVVLSALLLLLVPIHDLRAQESKAAPSRHITLEEAVDMALKHNHIIRLAALKVEEKEHAKDVARSAYFPLLRNDSNVLHVSDTQLIQISAGALGTVAGTPIPARTTVLNQGGQTFVTNGTSLTQPLTQLLRIKSANDIALTELNATRDKERQTENVVTLAVHQLYYRILIAQAHREATVAKIQASEALSKERVEQVKFGSTLEEEAIESRAQSLEAKQDLLSTDLLLSDLTMKLNDAIGLPLTTKLGLEAGVKQVRETCGREECLRVAQESHPEIAEARAEVEKASAGVRLAKRQYLPDVEAYARYSYQNNVPFLARNFGTFGVHIGFDIFDGGRKRAAVKEHNAQLAQAQENLARLTEEVELRVQTAYNKLERTRQMMKVSEELMAFRAEVRRVSTRQLQEGSALQSQLDAATAHELDAKTLLLQSQLDYIQARDEMTEAMGLRPD